MSELREECYKCLNNQSCPGAADYGSILCMTKRKYKMPGNEEDSIYANKFAIMQKQIDEKEKRIKELEAKQKEMCEEYCPKTERIKELEQENRSKQKAYDDCYCKYKHYKQFDSIPVQKVKDLIKNETINISGFECIAVEDIEKLVEDK